MNSDRNIILSIIIPVFNTERYLSQCLKSIYKYGSEYQKDYEIIIVDDGSTDDSSSIYNFFKINYSNIIIKKTANLGVSHARNIGISVARGEYITFVDSDDILTEDWHKIFKELRNNSSDIILYSKYFTKDKNASKAELYSYVFTYNPENIRISGPYSKFFKNAFLKNNKIQFREDIINGEDMLFNLHAIKYCNSYKLIKDSFYMVRHNPDSSTNSFDAKIFESELNLMKHIDKFIDDSNEPKINKYKNIMKSNMIRTLCIRISRINRYSIAKKEYKKIHAISKEVKQKTFYTRLLHVKMYYLLYLLCRHKQNNTETFELL